MAVAKQAFEDLQTLEGNSPRIAALVPFLLLGQARESFECDDRDNGEALLDKIEAGGLLIAIAGDCVRSMSAGKKRRREKVAAGKRLAETERPYLVWHCFRKLRHNFSRKDLPAAVQRQLENVDLTVLSFRDLFAIKDDEWRFQKMVWEEALAEAVKQTSLPSDVLVECLAGLRDIDPSLEDWQVREAAMGVTVAGIARDDEQLAVFLVYRAMIHHALLNDWGDEDQRDAARACLMVASRFADERDNDRTLLNTVSHIINFSQYRQEADRLKKSQLKKLLRTVQKTTSIDKIIEKAPSRRRKSSRRQANPSSPLPSFEDFEKMLDDLAQIVGMDDDFPVPDDPFSSPFPEPDIEGSRKTPKPKPKPKTYPKPRTQKKTKPDQTTEQQLPEKNRQLEFPDFF